MDLFTVRPELTIDEILIGLYRKFSFISKRSVIHHFLNTLIDKKFIIKDKKTTAKKGTAVPILYRVRFKSLADLAFDNEGVCLIPFLNGYWFEAKILKNTRGNSYQCKSFSRLENLKNPVAPVIATITEDKMDDHMQTVQKLPSILN